MTQILDGKKIADEIKKQLKSEWENSEKDPHRIPPKLGSICIGENASCKAYIASQKRLCDEFGIKHVPIQASGNASVKDIDQIIDELKRKDYVTGIIVQLPLPRNIDHMDLINRIGPKHDVECLHPENFEKFYSGYKGFAPCTSAAVMELLKHASMTGKNLLGKEIVIIGYSKIIGKPLILMLDEVATITTCHIGTSKDNLIAHINRADVLITAVGKSNFQIHGEWIKENAVVIDVATKRTKDGIVGDVDYKTAKERASFITPVPGGVGPITNVMLIKNLLYLYQQGNK